MKELVEALMTLPVYEDPAPALWAKLGFGERPLTLRTLRGKREDVLSVAQKVDENRIAIDQAVMRCRQIPPIPLNSIPFGF